MRKWAAALVLALSVVRTAEADSILLDATNETLELVTTAGVALDYTVSYRDYTNGRVIGGANTTAKVSSATTSTILPAPDIGVQRHVEWISITNTSGVSSNTVTLQINSGGTAYTITQPITLTSNQRIVVENDGHFTIYSNSGIPLGSTGGGGGSATFLDQSSGEVDLRYDASINGYYYDTDGDGVRHASGERESASQTFADDVWIDEFSTSSTTFGLQEAINHVCALNDIGSAAIVRIRGGRYSFTAGAVVTIPQNCDGLVISGSGSDIDNDGYSSATELISDHSGGAVTFLTIGSPTGTSTGRIVLSNLAIKIKSPQSGSIGVHAKSGSQFYIQNVSVSSHDGSLSPVSSANGIGIKIEDALSSSVVGSEITGFPVGVLMTGTTSGGGNGIYKTRVSSGSTTGIGVKIGEANAACSNFSIEDSTIEGNNIGVSVDTSSYCHVFLDGHFENANGSSSENVRATGTNAVVFSGGADLHGAATTFHRITQGSTDAVDTFLGSSIVSPITMDAGKCQILGVGFLASGVDVSNCERITHNAIVFEGATRDANETTISITDPTADRTVTIPNANSTTAQSVTCSGTDKISAMSSSGVFTCSTDSGGGSSLPVTDTTSIAQGSVDSTKQVRFEVDGLPTATTRVVTPASGADSVTVVADAGAANNFLTGITTAGVVTKAQPAFSNISGTAADAQIDGSLESDEVTGLTDAQVSNTLTASSLVGTGSTTNAVDLATAEVAGTLGVGNGGTGAVSFTANAILTGNGTSAIQASVGTIVSGAMDGITTADFDGAVTGPSFTADAAANPLITLDDSDTTPTADAQIAAQATTTTGGSEAVDVTVSALVAGALTQRAKLPATGAGAWNMPIEVDATDPADAESVRLDNNEGVAWEASPAGTDVVMKADASEIIQITGGTLDAGDLSGTVPDTSINGGNEEDEIDLTDLRDSGTNTCTGGQSVRRNAGDTAFECFTPSSGSANFVEKSIALTSDGGYFSATVTGATWVTSSSIIQCGVLGTTADGLTPEAISVANLNVTISNRVAGTGFDVVVFSPNGLEGTIRAHCVGA